MGLEDVWLLLGTPKYFEAWGRCPGKRPSRIAFVASCGTVIFPVMPGALDVTLGELLDSPASGRPRRFSRVDCRSCSTTGMNVWESLREIVEKRPGQDLNLRSLPRSGFRDRRDTGLRDLGSSEDLIRTPF